jgi:peptidoglycan/LPS O-acetylase OafA/YrhL
MSKLAYQPHIDGLRAVAVLSVLIYHINNDWLPGGFVGVDVFFVISGYLITNIITKSISENNFSIKIFYTRRIKRILPVYFLVSSVSIVFSWLLFFPRDFIDFSNSLLSSTFFVSNYYFWNTSGYFSSAIELKPLVHTWSLSVEEQFYVFWPLTLMVISQFKQPYLKKASFALFILSSLFLSYVLSISDPEFAYYSIVTRGFELLIGAIAAIYIKDYFSSSKLLSYFGAFLILISFILINKAQQFPGVIALIPCVGAILIILTAQANSWVTQLLKTKVMVNIGLISYSLYMWHWPVLAFARYYFTHLNTIHIFLLLVLIFVLSFLTRYTLEQKIIQAKFGLKKSFLSLFLLPACSFLIIAAYINYNDGVPSRFTASDLKLIEQTYTKNLNCSKERFDLSFEKECFIKSNQVKKKKILLWGDSHANHFSAFFEEAAKNEALDVYKMSFPGCPPIAGVYRINRTYSQSCYEHNLRVQEHLLTTNNFDYVALAANWANYPLADNLADDINKEISISNSQRAFYTNLQKQLEVFSKNGIKVIFLNSVPNFKSNASQCQLKHFIFGYPEEKLCERPFNQIQEDRLIYDKFLQSEMLLLEDVYVLDFTDIFCINNICKTYVDGGMMYRDQNHLSDYASQQLYIKTFIKGKTLLGMLGINDG